jgi:hypothetical protein
MAVQNFTVRLTGTTPLVLHNNQCVDARNPFKKKIAAITGRKGKKTESDLEELERLEFLSGMYMHDQHGPVIPAANLRRMLIDGARKDKNGKEFESGVFISEDAPIQYEGPRDAEGMWKEREKFAWSTIVKNQRASIVRTRPRFTKWGVEFQILTEDSLVSQDMLETALSRAALMCGIGDGRSIGCGRFKFEIV